MVTRVAGEHGFRFLLAEAAIYRGWALVQQGSVEAGLARATMQQRYERMGLDFHRRLAAGFRAIAAGEGKVRCRVVDATRDIATIGTEIEAIVAATYGLKA